MGLRAAVVIALVVIALSVLIAFGTPQAVVLIDVSEGGNATVRFVYRNSSSGRVSMYLPRFEKWNYTTQGGNIVNVVVSNTSAYFYHNVTFVYEVAPSGEFVLNISYNFPFAALYTSDRGWFMSPLLGAAPLSSVSVVITIVDLGSVKAVTLDGTPVSYAREGGTLRVSLPAFSIRGARVTIDFKPSKPVEETILSENADGIRVNLQAAPFYRGLLQKVVKIVSNAAPMLREILGYHPQTLDFKPFLPTMMDLSALGYVMGEDINAGGEGPIYLNLALIRFKEGYMETTIVHELVHKALGALGVPASRELRWFHEGVAQYASLKICEKVGYDVGDIYATLEEAAGLFRKGIVKPEFVSYWNPPAGDEGRYYVASYFIVSSLAEGRGGLAFIQRVAEEIRRRSGVESNKELIEALSAAAGEDLTPLFRSWGFPVEETAPRAVTRARSKWIVVIVAAIIAAIVAFSLAIILSRRTVRCPYCYADVPKDAVFCPYCGYPLK